MYPLYFFRNHSSLCSNKRNMNKRTVGKKKKWNNDYLNGIHIPCSSCSQWSEGFKETQLLMYRTFGLLREHCGTDKILILLVFLICVILLLTELEDEFLSKLLISSSWNTKSPSSEKCSLSSSPILGPSLSMCFYSTSQHLCTYRSTVSYPNVVLVQAQPI